MSKVIQVIESVEYRGEGTPENPHRIVTVYYAFDGAKLFERDSWIEQHVTAKSPTPASRSASPQ